MSVAVLEREWVPAVLLAMKVKAPTADKNVGGSRKFDYFPYLILSYLRTTRGRLDFQLKFWREFCNSGGQGTDGKHGRMGLGNGAGVYSEPDVFL